MKKNLLRFLVIWLGNALVIYLVANLLPGSFFLRNYWLSPIGAAALTGFLITALTRVVKVLLQKKASRWLKGRWGMLAFYWLVNSALVWLLARLAPLTGLGITAFYWAFVLGLALNLIQWVARQMLKMVKLI